MLNVLAALSVGYLLGGVPAAQLAARLKGKDIFELGSGNMGALNTARNLGWLAGLLVAAADVGKGALAMFLGLKMGGQGPGSSEMQLLMGLVAGVGAVLGHAYSPFAQFSGGKAIATTFGITLPLFPLVGVYYLALILSLYLLLRRVTPAGLIGALALPLLALQLLPRWGWESDQAFLTTTLLLPVGVIGALKHAQAWMRERSREKSGA